MATEFSREFFADNRIVKAELRSARKPREEELNRIRAEVRKLYDATEVILNVTVDESLLSGYVLQVGDRVFDNSGRHQLDKMMEGKPSLATLKTRIEDYKPAETSAEGGVVISSADGIVHVEGMNRASVAFCVDAQSEAEGILNDITKQKGPPFSGEPLRIKNQLRRRLFMPSRRTTYRKMLMKSRYNVSAP